MTFCLVSMLMVSCGDNGGADAPALTGRTFLSDSVTVNGSAHPLVTGTQIRLTITADHRITASAGCNILSGSVRVDDDRLVVSGLGSTEMGCDPPRQAQDEWLASFLAANPTYVLDYSGLQLRGNDTVVELRDREVADPDRPLQQTVWVVDGLISGSTASSMPAGASATIVFDQAGLHVVIDACNSISGSVRIASSTIDIGHLVTTDVACAQPAASLEAAIAEVLVGKITYAIDAASLRLTHPTGKGLTLRAR
ncbi:MAG: META domain-containing protein [Acidimicrobiales bacterium]